MQLNNKKVAILAADGFEQSELFEPKQALEDAGAKTHVVSIKPGSIKGWKDGDWGREIAVDVTLDQANAAHYDALLIPGGVINPDKLRMNEGALDFVRAFFADKRPVAAICHAPQVLISAGVVKGRDVTSYASVRIDLENAGANWSDQEVVTDNGLVTSRTPKDLPAFNAKMIEEIAEGKHD